uniref:Uncharacterized protein n=1 Tax=Utricularia reniformis TaxID=192314 RepID=A0A1Y0AZA3_9LAMI|nr:hypothetical protein AEK19_MT0226 [Utricularia reniformis]ART30505.1 hypothetical protein AEK19_MT0226 [Utricularia reniformis]
MPPSVTTTAFPLLYVFSSSVGIVTRRIGVLLVSTHLLRFPIYPQISARLRRRRKLPKNLPPRMDVMKV